jgi:hypothetical protein
MKKCAKKQNGQFEKLRKKLHSFFLVVAAAVLTQLVLRIIGFTPLGYHYLGPDITDVALIILCLVAAYFLYRKQKRDK